MNCLLKCAAALLGEEEDTLVKEIGHDGMEVIWPDLNEPYNRRGFHICEIQDCFLRRGYALACVQAVGVLAPSSPLPAGESYQLQYVQPLGRYKYLLELLVGRNAIILSQTHAYYKFGTDSDCFDPATGMIQRINFPIREIYLVLNTN